MRLHAFLPNTSLKEIAQHLSKQCDHDSSERYSFSITKEGKNKTTLLQYIDSILHDYPHIDLWKKFKSHVFYLSKEGLLQKYRSLSSSHPKLYISQQSKHDLLVRCFELDPDLRPFLYMFSLSDEQLRQSSPLSSSSDTTPTRAEHYRSIVDHNIVRFADLTEKDEFVPVPVSQIFEEEENENIQREIESCFV